MGQSEKLQSSNTQPVQIELVPTQTMTRGGGMSVMVVMPAFTKCQQCYPPAIARVVTGFESRFSPQVCSRIDQPRRMQAQRNAEKHSPKHYTPTSKRKEHQPD